MHATEFKAQGGQAGAAMNPADSTATTLVRLGLLLLLAAWVAARTQAEEFVLRPGDIVRPGQPSGGAGILAAGAYSDIYRFEAAAGQILFLEELEIAPALRGWLRWELKTPGGQSIFSQLFNLQGAGRRVLPEAGFYTLRFFLSANDPSHVGDYAFHLRALPPDGRFEVQIGDTIRESAPAAGAGRIEMAGAEDVYTFTAAAGQPVFFEEVEVAPALLNALRWECRSPNGQFVFGGLFKPRVVGRRNLPEAGVYSIRFFVSDADPAHFGAYAFRTRPVPVDPVFPLALGTTVSDGTPQPGAGRLDAAGAEDHYTFTGSAGQAVFFEELNLAAALNGSLRWECTGPGGALVFSGLFRPQGTGRKTLPATGLYTIRCFTSANDPEDIGAYSFRISAPLSDTTFAIAIGQTIPGDTATPGMGNIETPGTQDLYTFQGTEGQRVVFAATEVAEPLVGSLRWELKTPTGSHVFSHLFRSPLEDLVTLPETGVYSLRLFVSDTSSSRVGRYGFRLFSPVRALPDTVATTPDAPVSIPIARLLCNDLAEAGDVLDIHTATDHSAQGGRMEKLGATIRYTPPEGFVGDDHFDCRLAGRFGGESIAGITVRVFPEAATQAAVVSVSMVDPAQARACLLGRPATVYRVFRSDDLMTWAEDGQVTTDADGGADFVLPIGATPQRFHRFVRP